MNAADRFCRSRLQLVFGWLCAAIIVGVSVMVLVLPTARCHGGYVIRQTAHETAPASAELHSAYGLTPFDAGSSPTLQKPTNHQPSQQVDR